MADVSKIKLPDNNEYNIKDARIAGVDASPTSGSDNVVKSGGVYSALGDYLPLSGGEMEDGASIRLKEADGLSEYSTSISSTSVEINNEIDGYWTAVDGEYPGFTAASGVGGANEKSVTLSPEGISYKPSPSASSNTLTFPAKDGTLAVTSDIPSVDSSPTSGSSNAVSSDGVYTAINNIPSLPSVTSSDNGKVLQVSSGAWTADSLSGYLPLAGGTMTGPIEFTPTTSSAQTSDGIDFGSVAHIASDTNGGLGIFADDSIQFRPSGTSSYGLGLSSAYANFNLTGWLAIVTATTGTPTLLFRRGTTSDAYVDWKIRDSSGVLEFLRSVSGTDTVILSANATALFPTGTITNNVSDLSLGDSTHRWANVYSKDGTFSGDVTVTGNVTASNIPTYHTGTSDPSSSLGNDGDIYLKLSS